MLFPDKTVLVLGAGASRPYGFPTSGELRKLVLGGKSAAEVFKALDFPESALLEHERDLESAVNRHEVLHRFRKIFFDAQRVSIDAFVGSRSIKASDAATVQEIARHVIARTILRCEANALQDGHLDGGWYQWLLELLIREGPEFSQRRLSVVTFNYDRSLEFYLYRAFRAAFGIEQDEAHRMLQRIEFVHVYGSVGKLPTERESTTPEEGIPFGDMRTPGWAAKSVQVVMPRTPPETQTRVRQLIAEASRLVFLGFGFWEENMDVLHDDNPKSDDNARWHEKKIYAPATSFRAVRARPSMRDLVTELVPMNH